MAQATRFVFAMRVLFVYGVVLYFVLFLLSGFDSSSPFPAGFLILFFPIILFFVLCDAITWIFNRIFDPTRDLSKVIREYEEQGVLVLIIQYKAKRAVQIPEYEDEGIYLWIELEDGSVLHLCGQYLYDYVGDEDDATDSFLHRRLPCTEFTLRRHAEKNFTVDIVCEGRVIEPEWVVPTMTVWEIRGDIFAKDGEIVKNFTYEQVKAELSR